MDGCEVQQLASTRPAISILCIQIDVYTYFHSFLDKRNVPLRRGIAEKGFGALWLASWGKLVHGGPGSALIRECLHARDLPGDLMCRKAKRLLEFTLGSRIIPGFC